MSKVRRTGSPASRTLGIASAAVLLLGGCAATETGRRHIYDSSYYAPVDGQARNIFIDPIGVRDRQIPQRLGRLDVAPPPTLIYETERAAAARARLNSRPLAVPATPGQTRPGQNTPGQNTPGQTAPKLDPTAQPGADTPARARTPARAAAPGIAPPRPDGLPTVTIVPANGTTPPPAVPVGPKLPGSGPGPVTKPASP